MSDLPPNRHLAAAAPILYVDDERPNRLLLLTTYGDEFDIVLAASGQEALAILDSQPIGVLLTDNRMPHMSGVELCERCRDLHPDVLRILVTAYSGEKTAIDAINRGGVSRYVRKPWDPHEVRQVLRDAVARVALEKTVRRLRASIHDRERLLGESAARARLLRDLGRVGVSLAATTRRLRNLEGRLREELRPALYADFERQIRSLERYVEYVGGLQAGDATGARMLSAEGESLCPLLEAAVSVACGELEGAARVRVECAHEVTVWADRIEFSRLVVRLIRNSMRATEIAGGPAEVLVHAELHGGSVTVRIADHGPPLEPDQLRGWLSREVERTDIERLDEALRECEGLAAGLGAMLDAAARPVQGFSHTFDLTLPARQPSKAPRLRRT